MTSTSSLLDLQWAQLTHDERYHKDIIVLPLGDRVRHMALHMAKYAGNIAEIEGDDPQRVARILTDAFVITLATANALNQDLGQEVCGGGPTDLQRLGQTLASDFGGSNDLTGLLRPFARHAGALAKACESLDHVESYPFREAMKSSNLALFKLVVSAAAVRALDLDALYKDRMREIEMRSIFDSRLQPASGRDT